MDKSFARSAFAGVVLLSLLLAGCQGGQSATTDSSGAGTGTGTGTGGTTPPPPPSSNTGPVAASDAAVLLGKRLFRETRFANFYMANSNGDVNATLSSGDPTVNSEMNASGNPATLPDPMAGTSINCEQCHLGAQDQSTPGGGMRAFTDYALHSPIPARANSPTSLTTTPRNSTTMVDSMLHGDVDQILHWDGQFGSMQELVAGTLTGRNFGWLATEQTEAQHQVAQVIRGDNGSDALATKFSGGTRYSDLFQCSSKVPAQYQLPKQDCIDVTTASDAEIVNQVGTVMSAYLSSLHFARDGSGQYTGSPYDQFLIANGLPRSPASGQTPIQYGAKLLQKLETLSDPKFINQGNFKYHGQRPFVFGANELNGLMEFLRRPAGAVITSSEAAGGTIGNCAACHAPPDFTDFRMHNVGSTQFEYDAVNGAGTFESMNIPDLTTRNGNPNAYLPVTPQHPQAQETFRMPANASIPTWVDLGAWNIFANPDFPDRQASLEKFICAIDSGQFADCSETDAQLLDRSIAVFRTHTLRDLGDSAPYMHSGFFASLDDVASFYSQAGAAARNGTLRNADPQMQNVALDQADLPDLVALLESLDEDYVPQ
ncbi:MAG TPA: hypothetical protein VGH91_13605 [Gammaproteobacteria bacterium]|jgi:hypothetical protein